MEKHIIDCNVNPIIPRLGNSPASRWSVVSHQKNGIITFDLSKIELFLVEKQKIGEITGYELRKELNGKPALNANVLDYLLEHREIIPDEWKNLWIFFWGTIYNYSFGANGEDCVRCLCFEDFKNGKGERIQGLCWRFRSLSQSFLNGNPTPILLP